MEGEHNNNDNTVKQHLILWLLSPSPKYAAGCEKPDYMQYLVFTSCLMLGYKCNCQQFYNFTGHDALNHLDHYWFRLWGNLAWYRCDKILIQGCIFFRYESDLIIHIWIRYVLPYLKKIQPCIRILSYLHQAIVPKVWINTDQVDLGMNQALCLSQACKIVKPGSQ